jgi:hypothetical protein
MTDISKCACDHDLLLKQLIHGISESDYYYPCKNVLADQFALDGVQNGCIHCIAIVAFAKFKSVGDEHVKDDERIRESIEKIYKCSSSGSPFALFIVGMLFLEPTHIDKSNRRDPFSTETLRLEQDYGNKFETDPIDYHHFLKFVYNIVHFHVHPNDINGAKEFFHKAKEAGLQCGLVEYQLGVLADSESQYVIAYQLFCTSSHLGNEHAHKMRDDLLMRYGEWIKDVD